MFFTRVGKIIAHVIFWVGVIRVGTGFLIAFGAPDMESNALASRRYLAAATSGEAINEGGIAILLAVVIGVLCEINSNSKV
ncbi:hypothetical protein [Rhizobium mesosinicum]|uniref:Uncharacterized protein n=1 Tax=Rhizobium mesosinicum TaxID=335017 RepID=A0ABS7GUJ5_9HYPH|nr:hypothetical protein [Rhizobium mesosinicum]MBW9053477.1 hypothetical protein [Rhizobium mesosinicum]